MYGRAWEAFPAEWKAQPASVAVVIGTGWNRILPGALFSGSPAQGIDFTDLPGLRAPDPTLSHRGRFLLHYVNTQPVLVIDGRLHYYDTLDLAQSSLPLWLALKLGARTIVLTNASGALNPSYELGEIVALKDAGTLHTDPLWGIPRGLFSHRKFIWPTAPFSPRLRDGFREACQRVGREMREGHYYYLPGPVSQTPFGAEMLRRLGADMVGMSTYCEALQAAVSGAEVLALSCITDHAGLDGRASPTATEVGAVYERASRQYGDVLEDFIRSLIEGAPAKG